MIIQDFSRNKTIIILLLLTLVNLSASAQKWATATIDKISKTAYYNILLDQRMIAVSDINLSTIKVTNQAGVEIPYFVRTSNPIETINEFVIYPLIKNVEKDSVNLVIIKNENSKKLNSLAIILENADVDKYVSVRGSNDQKKWYVVKQTVNLNHSGVNYGNKEVLIVDLPDGNYLYYEITLVNNHNSPLKILNVGQFEDSNIYLQQSIVDLGRFIKSDSVDKKSYIYFPDLLYNYRIDKLTFYINNKAEYFRNVSVSNELTFSLSSNNENSISLNSYVFTPDTKIIIDNKGNLPLVVDSIKATGLNRYICAYFESDQNYTITIGNPKMVPTDEYDIKLFKKDIPETLDVLQTSNLQFFDLPNSIITEKVREKIWIEKPIFLWSIILVVGLFLSIICYKMVMEMNKRS